MSTVPEFLGLVGVHGSDVIYHRNDSMVPCPCRTKRGNRNPQWHLEHPDAPVCNEAGMLPDPTASETVVVKGFIQPVQSGAVRRLTSETLESLFGEIEADDHLGILPVEWGTTLMNFYDWGLSGEDWLEYNGRRYTVVSSNLIPDPSDGNPWHHWEVGLRLIRTANG